MNKCLYMKSKVIKDVRDIFAQRNFMLPFAGNFKNDSRFGNGMCKECSNMCETQQHVTGYVLAMTTSGQCQIWTEWKAR